jgi:hypothetical protein
MRPSSRAASSAVRRTHRARSVIACSFDVGVGIGVALDTSVAMEPAEPAAAMSVDDFLKALPDLVENDDSLARARARAKTTTGIQPTDGETLGFSFTPPIDAKKLAKLLRIKGELFIVSGDVHQRSWELRVGGGRVPDPHNQRIATDMPTFGSWKLDIGISERPGGPLPKLVAGASPAYPLAGRTALVTRMRFWK